MTTRVIGSALVAIGLIVSVLLALSPGMTSGVPSVVFWLLAAACGLVLVIALAVQYGPSLVQRKPTADDVEKHIKEAEWYLEVGDINDGWQAYIKAKRSLKHLPAEQQAEARDRILALYGELDQASKK